jgi:hypothetical protein
MPLLEFWKSNREAVSRLKLEAIIGLAGEKGVLKDGSDTAHEWRTYLQEVAGEKLAEYALYCLENAFTNSGQVLQDVINEIGRRLGFEVENGRYHGVRGEIGFDGIWRTPDVSLIVEVKTTDAYTITLDVIAKYRDRLFEGGRVTKDAPILLVIGRNDTQSLEAQVRGSRHAWSMRIISIDALIKLMEVNLSTSSREVTEKIHTILQPMEYTRLDAIVDVMFAAAEDKDAEIAELEEPGAAEDAPTDSTPRVQDRTDRDVLIAKKELAIASLGRKLGMVLVKRKHSMYSDSANEVHAVCSVSKRYDRSESFYWYAYHEEPQRTFLKAAKAGYMLFGMVDADVCLAVPVEFLDKHWDDLYQTVRQTGKSYKHIQIYDDGGKLSMRIGNTGVNVDMTPYVIGLKADA